MSEEWVASAMGWLANIAYALVLLLVVWVVAGWVKRTTIKGLARAKFDATLSAFLSNLVRWVILLLGVLAVLGRKGETVETYDDLNELGYKYPWLGAAMAVFMLSAAGIPKRIARPIKTIVRMVGRLLISPPIPAPNTR